MDTEDNGDVGFKQNVVLNCPSSGIDSNSMSSDKVTVMAICSESMFKTPTGEETFYGSSWDPLVVPLNHGHNFNGCGGSSIIPHSEFGNSHYSTLLENKPVGSSSHLVHHYTSDSAMVNMVPKIPSFGSGNFSDMTSSFGLPGCSQVADANFHQIYTSMKPVGSQEDVLILEERAFGGKNKRKASESTSPLGNKKKNVEREQQKDPSENSSEHSREKDEMKQKLEQNNTRGKQPCKQTKDNNSISEEPSKETYIHMRAKRGQATNSHSLAERVRRERISERMRLLQELVPGCNKITGKAVMLDEIINYVQSLQQQVEFLSMKLATVNPEVNFDLDRIFSKDILHPSRGINAANLNIGQGSISSNMFPGIGFPQGTFPGIPDASQTFHPLPQSVWDNELHNLLQMGFDSDTSTTNPAQNARAKLELWSSREK